MSIPPRSRRLRVGRHSQSGQMYMITAVTYGRQPVFNDWQAGRLLVHPFRKAPQDELAHSLAWVVMPDHFHWLVQLECRICRQRCTGSNLAPRGR